VTRVREAAGGCVEEVGGGGALGARDRLAAYEAALRRLTPVLAFAIVPAVFMAVAVYALIGHGFAIDFDGQFWPAGRRVLHGLSPYDLEWQDIGHDVAFPYNSVAALLFTPFALLPHGLADAVFTGLCVGALLLTLRVLAVHDWRIYGIVFLWEPVLSAWATANVTLLLGLGLALMWRHRDKAVVVGVLFALLVSVKLLMWPLAIWLVGSRRYAALAWTLAAGLVMNVTAWAVLGFDQIGPYLKVLGLVSDREELRSYTVLAFALHHGAGRAVGYALTIALAGTIAAGAFVLARRGREAQCVLLCVAGCLVATPVTWAHYFALFVVPLALLCPRLRPVWALPLVMLLCPGVAPASWQLVLVLATGAGLVWVALRTAGAASAV
jgi:hypothetical protein